MVKKRRISAISKEEGSVGTRKASKNGDKVLTSWKDLYDSPAVKYVAAGIAATAFSKLIKTISKRYPELTKILSEGLDEVEDQLVSYKKTHKGETHLQH